MLKLMLQYHWCSNTVVTWYRESDAGKDWRQVEKGMTEDKMVGWYHWLNGHESEQAPGDAEGQGSLACCSPRGLKEADTSESLSHISLLLKNVNSNNPEYLVWCLVPKSLEWCQAQSWQWWLWWSEWIKREQWTGHPSSGMKSFLRPLGRNSTGAETERGEGVRTSRFWDLGPQRQRLTGGPRGICLWNLAMADAEWPQGDSTRWKRRQTQARKNVEPVVRKISFQSPVLPLTSYVTLRWVLPPRFLQKLTEMTQVKHLACWACGKMREA